MPGSSPSPAAAPVSSGLNCVSPGAGVSQWASGWRTPQDRRSWGSQISWPHGQRTYTSELCPVKGLRATQRTQSESPAPGSRPGPGVRPWVPAQPAAGSLRTSQLQPLPVSSHEDTSPGGRGSPAPGCSAPIRAGQGEAEVHRWPAEPVSLRPLSNTLSGEATCPQPWTGGRVASDPALLSAP